MTKYRKVLALGCLLATLPFASAAMAQNLSQQVASDGRLAPMAEATSNVVPGARGSGVGAAARESSPAEMSRLLALRAMVGPGSPAESIIGADNRILVSPTTGYPYRAVVLITFNTGSGGARCTGWLINANTVATAGHCVAAGGQARFYNRFTYTIWPGRNGSTAPYGSCGAYRLYTVSGWYHSGNDGYDYGAIKLNCNVGNTVGWFGFFWTTGSLLNFHTTVSGYPGDKPLTQWRSEDFVRATDALRVFYQNDTVGGNSGGPVYVYWQNCFPCGTAVHAYGSNGTNNHGTRITQSVFNNFLSWRAAAGAPIITSTP